MNKLFKSDITDTLLRIRYGNKYMDDLVCVCSSEVSLKRFEWALTLEFLCTYPRAIWMHGGGSLLGYVYDHAPEFFPEGKRTDVKKRWEAQKRRYGRVLANAYMEIRGAKIRRLIYEEIARRLEVEKVAAEKAREYIKEHPEVKEALR